MRAWKLTGRWSDSPRDALELDGFASDPSTPVGAEVLVRVHAAALNFRDVMIMRGSYAIAARAGTVPLSDGAGEVIAVGPDARRFSPGDRVASTYFPGWVDGHLTAAYLADQFGASRDGLLADYLLCGEHELVSVPDHLSAEEAATLPCSALTAWSALTGPHPVLPGQTILTLGTGGVSLFAVQFAKVMGARIVAATSSEAKAERLTELGADVVINYRNTPLWAEEVLAVTGGAGVDRVIETVGPDTLEQSVRCTALGGEIAHVGGGGFSADGPTTLFDPRVLHGRSLALRRVTVGSRHDFDAMNRAISHHRIRPIIDRVFSFADAADAYRQITDRSHVGKVVIGLNAS